MIGYKQLLAVLLLAFVSLKTASAITYGYGPYNGPRVGGLEPYAQAPVPKAAPVDQETMASAESMQVYYEDLLRLQNIMEHEMIPTQVQQFHADDDDY